MCRKPIITFIFILTLLLLLETLNAQPQSQWIRNIDANGGECFWDVYAVHDGSYIAVGATGNQWWNGGVWLMTKVNENGQTIWTNTYGNFRDGAAARSVIEADNGDFAAAGLNGRNGSVEVMRVDPEGEQVWRSQYLSGEAKAIIELKSGEFLVVGVSNMQGFILLIDGDGRELWRSIYPIGNQMGAYGYFTSIRETDNQVVVSGEGRRSVNELWHIWLMKIDLESEGDIVWERHHTVGRISTCNTIISCEGGFALSGMANGFNTYLMKVNDEGEALWNRIYEVQTSIEIGYCLAQLDDGGYAIAGRGQNPRDPNLLPLIIRTNEEGAELGRSYVDFSEIEGFNVGRNTLYSIVLGIDNSLVAAGIVNSNDTGDDGLILKWEVEQAGPYFVYWTPEDTVLTVLPGDSIQFAVHANHQWQDSFDIYWWLADGDTISNDTTITETFEELGEYTVNCGINDGVRSALKTWHISAVEFYINGFQPDTTDVTIRRNNSIDFSLDIRSIEDVNLDYSWIRTGRNENEEYEGEDSISVDFMLMGDFQIEARVTNDERTERVIWNIEVASCLWWWWPRELSLEIPIFTNTEFSLIPFNRESDSLSYLWIIEEDTLGSADITWSFGTTGQHEVRGFLRDGSEVDSVNWSITAFRPNDVQDATDLSNMEATVNPVAPNPFNSSIRISYRLFKENSVSIKLYDFSGRLINTIMDENQISGYHTVYWDSGNSPSGIYFLKFNLGGVNSIQKLVLTK